MPPDLFVSIVVEPGLHLLPPRMDSIEARFLLTAIGYEETALCARHQTATGSAHSFYQLERLGAVAGVLNGPAGAYARAACDILAIGSDLDTVFEAVRLNDALATVIARLTLWLDPHRLPAVGDAATSWNYYLRCWNPGDPGPERWPQACAAGVAAVS